MVKISFFKYDIYIYIIYVYNYVLPLLLYISSKCGRTLSQKRWKKAFDRTVLKTPKDLGHRRKGWDIFSAVGVCLIVFFF